MNWGMGISIKRGIHMKISIKKEAILFITVLFAVGLSGLFNKHQSDKKIEKAREILSQKHQSDKNIVQKIEKEQEIMDQSYFEQIRNYAIEQNRCTSIKLLDGYWNLIKKVEARMVERGYSEDKIRLISFKALNSAKTGK